MSSPVGNKIEKGLFEHRWECVDCEKTYFLSVDMSKDRDRKRLDMFYSAVTIHCLNFKHSVGHKQKEKKFNIRYG